ncbi:translation elongation factor Ts [Candidatus Margulisiibacteriota bacterium]
MVEITAKLVNSLRKKSGAGLMDCKKALQETKGDEEKAIEILRKKGIASASKRSGRETANGKVISYIHLGGKIGVLLEINCETDFVAKTDDFNELGKNIAMHIAAANPLYVDKENIPAEDLEKEKKFLKEKTLEEGKPEKVVDKIVEGRINKFIEENCLLSQNYVRDPDKKVEDVIKEVFGKLGENITISRFVRYEIGGG